MDAQLTEQQAKTDEEASGHPRLRRFLLREARAARKLAAVLILLFLLFQLVFQPSGLTDYYLLRVFRLARIVRYVEKTPPFPIQPGQSFKVRLPRELEHISVSGDVWVEGGAHGPLSILVETRDYGHMGAYGYLYLRDANIPPRTYRTGPEGEYRCVVVPGGGPWYLRKRVSCHWWAVESED